MAGAVRGVGAVGDGVGAEVGDGDLAGVRTASQAGEALQDVDLPDTDSQAADLTVGMVSQDVAFPAVMDSAEADSMAAEASTVVEEVMVVVVTGNRG